MNLIISCPCSYWEEIDNVTLDTAANAAREKGWHYVRINRLRMTETCPLTARGECQECFEMDLVED